MTTYTIRTSDDASTTARTLEDLGTLDHVRIEHAGAALGAYRELSPYDLEGARAVDTSGYTATVREAARLCQVIAEDIGAMRVEQVSTGERYTRQAYDARFTNEASAIEFEATCLGAIEPAMEGVPAIAIKVRNGGKTTPEYWRWLCGQSDAQDRQNAIESGESWEHEDTCPDAGESTTRSSIEECWRAKPLPSPPAPIQSRKEPEPPLNIKPDCEPIADTIAREASVQAATERCIQYLRSQSGDDPHAQDLLYALDKVQNLLDVTDKTAPRGRSDHG